MAGKTFSSLSRLFILCCFSCMNPILKNFSRNGFPVIELMSTTKMAAALNFEDDEGFAGSFDDVLLYQSPLDESARLKLISTIKCKLCLRSPNSSRPNKLPIVRSL